MFHVIVGEKAERLRILKVGKDVQRPVGHDRVIHHAHAVEELFVTVEKPILSLQPVSPFEGQHRVPILDDGTGADARLKLDVHLGDHLGVLQGHRGHRGGRHLRGRRGRRHDLQGALGRDTVVDHSRVLLQLPRAKDEPLGRLEPASLLEHEDRLHALVEDPGPAPHVLVVDPELRARLVVRDHGLAEERPRAHWTVTFTLLARGLHLLSVFIPLGVDHGG